MSRDSELLICGGANYSYAQIAEDFSQVLVDDFHLKPEQFKLAVVGLRIESEHEDSCCLTIELTEEVQHMKTQLNDEFVEMAVHKVPKNVLPKYIRFAPVPVSFKGAILYPELRQEFIDHIQGT